VEPPPVAGRWRAAQRTRVDLSPPPADEAPEGAVYERRTSALRTFIAPAWVDPEGNFCPSTHPVKAKLSSGLFHLPGMAAYARTAPDRCYRDEQAALGAGLTRAKR